MKHSRSKDLVCAFFAAVSLHFALGIVADFVWLGRWPQEVSYAFDSGKALMKVNVILDEKEKEDRTIAKTEEIIDPQPQQTSLGKAVETEEPTQPIMAPVIDDTSVPPPLVERAEADRAELVPDLDTGVSDAGHRESKPDTSWVGLSEIRPKYPFGSRLRGEEGRVVIRALVSPSGKAETVEVLVRSGFRMLDKAAVDAVKNAHFVPGGRACAEGGVAILTFVFQLTD